MWMDEDATQSEPAALLPVPSMVLGAEQLGLGTLMGGLSFVINSHKSALGAPPSFRVVDMKMGNGDHAAGLVDMYRSRHDHQSRPIIISGIDNNSDQLETVKSRLAEMGALGQVHPIDATSTPSANIRNRLECAGGGDLVLLAHAAYPSHLPSFKLPRMVDRISDMVAPYGAVVTVHNHGASDADQIRSKALGLPNFSAPGLRCDTHPRLEQAFKSGKLHAFSVTVPNVVKLPANATAVDAIFSGAEASLSGSNAVDAAKIRNVLELLAGGAEALNDAIAGMDDAARQQAAQLFADKIEHAKQGEMAITVGGGQMVMAFRDQTLAREAFKTIREEAQNMSPPAIALPISASVAPNFDKHAAHLEWKTSLAADHGITSPPSVPQMAGRESQRS